MDDWADICAFLGDRRNATGPDANISMQFAYRLIQLEIGAFLSRERISKEVMGSANVPYQQRGVDRWGKL